MALNPYDLYDIRSLLSEEERRCRTPSRVSPTSA
jgi:hypothetical protein